MPAYKYTLKNNKTRWYAAFYYTDWTGTRRHKCKKGFLTQREAKEYEANFLDQQTNSCDILFTSLTKSWIIDTKLLPYFKKLKINEIDTLKVRQWQNVLISYRDENGNPYSQTYLKTIHNQLSAILNYAVSHYGLRINPCKITGSIGKSKAGEMNIWTHDEYKKFSATVKKSGLKLAFDILFYTGIRSGELLALTPEDIKPNKRIQIIKNFAKLDGEELFLDPKTEKSERSIAIPEFLYNDIQNYISKLYGIQPNDRIFYFTDSALEKEIHRGADAANLKHIRVHDLRHSHASMLINMNFSFLEIKDRLGHESVKTTIDTYGHLYPDKDIELAEALNKLK